jgi:hypothetical protein
LLTVTVSHNQMRGGRGRGRGGSRGNAKHFPLSPTNSSRTMLLNAIGGASAGGRTHDPHVDGPEDILKGPRPMQPSEKPPDTFPV